MINYPKLEEKYWRKMGDKKRKNAGKSETLRGKQNDRARQDKRKKKRNSDWQRQ